MQQIILKIKYFKRRLSKSLEKVHLSFLSNLVSFNEQDYEKQKGFETSDQSLYKLQNKHRKIPLLVIKSRLMM